MAKIKGEAQWRGRKVPVTILSGEPYMEVATKIALAHEDGGYTEVGHEFVSVGGKDVIRIQIECKGQRFFGSAQIKWGGKNADATDPVENAETSALGRALSGAGYQINSVASAEDMEGVLSGRGRVIESEPAQIAPPRYLSLDCAALAKELGLSEADYKLKVRSYTSPEGKIAWQSVWSALSTMKSERTLIQAEVTANARIQAEVTATA